MIFSAWILIASDGAVSRVFQQGLEMPTDGAYDDEQIMFDYLIDADSWEQAQQENYRRRGWGSYVPMGYD